MIVRLKSTWLIGDDNDVTLFASKVRTDNIPGLPKLDSGRVVRYFPVLAQAMVV